MKTKKKKAKQPLFPRGVTFEDYWLNVRIEEAETRLYNLITQKKPEDMSPDEKRIRRSIFASRANKYCS